MLELNFQFWNQFWFWFHFLNFNVISRLVWNPLNRRRRFRLQKIRGTGSEFYFFSAFPPQIRLALARGGPYPNLIGWVIKPKSSLRSEFVSNSSSSLRVRLRDSCQVSADNVNEKRKLRHFVLFLQTLSDAMLKVSLTFFVNSGHRSFPRFEYFISNTRGHQLTTRNVISLEERSVKQFWSSFNCFSKLRLNDELEN